MKTVFWILPLCFFSISADAQTNPLCRMTFNGCAFHGWETSACSFAVSPRPGPPRYDGHWWRSVSVREQISFLNGFRDAYVFEYHGPMRYSLVAPFEWQREISAWYARTPSAVEMPAPEFILRTRAVTDQQHTPSREDGLGPHGGYDGSFWRQARALGGTNEQRGFVAGYLWCHANVAKNHGGVFSKSPDEYTALITQWYANDGTLDRDAEKIADVLFTFRDPEPAVIPAGYPHIDALLSIHSNFLNVASLPDFKTPDSSPAEQDAWRSNGYPNFQVSVPSPNSLTVPPGGSASAAFQIATMNNFTGEVILSATGLPAGVQATFTRLDPLTFQMTLTASKAAAIGACTATILGRATGVPFLGGHRATLPVLVSPNVAQVAVNLGSVASVYGLGNDHLVLGDNGGIDGGGFAYSEILLGPGVTWSMNQFAFRPPANGEPESHNAVTGTTIPLPAGRYSSLKMLGSANGGDRLDQPFVITYSDGSSVTFTQSLSDWTTPQRYLGESTVATNVYCDLHMGTFTSERYLYGYAFPLDPGKIAKSFKMPGSSTSPGKSGVVAVALTLGWDAHTSPDFALSASSRNLSFGQNSRIETTIRIDALNNFNRGVSLSVSGLPNNVMASFAPPTTSDATTLVLTTSDSVAIRRFTMTVTGVCGELTRSLAINLE